MSLAPSDRELVVEALGRDPTDVEAALFENLWSEHCAYRSSRPLLTAFESEGDAVVVGPGDDAAIVRIADDWAIAMGIESHNHPSYVDPYDGAATGVGGIVRDILSMGAYPIALADSLYFGPFEDEHPRYLFEGVVEGIGDYGNSIGVPTVTGSVDFHPDYAGNPLVNVGCVGLLPIDRIVRAAASTPGEKLVLVGNATGRDGLGGASFASEDLAEDAETEDRPAVQVGDPYAEKLLIEANEALLDAGLVRAARDLGAAGLGGASSEMVAQGGTGARIDLERVHQREPDMRPLEILLAESQERMCYAIKPGDVDEVRAIADRYDLGCSVVGEVTDGNYVCTFGGETVVDVPAELLADGAPTNELDATPPEHPDRDLPDPDLQAAFEAVIGDPNIVSRRWVYRQYDHEVGLRTAVRPGADAALMAVHEVGVGVGISAGADPRWTSAAPYDGARAVAMENATNLAAIGATPLAAVDCLNGGNPEKPDVYGGFSGIVDGLADMCRTLDVPVVGGNVSLYNDSASGPIPPTPTLMMVGTREGVDAPAHRLTGDGTVCLVGPAGGSLGGSVYLEAHDGDDRFPALPSEPARTVRALVDAASLSSTLAAHDVSHGGLAVTLAELVSNDVGLSVSLGDEYRPEECLFSEVPGRLVVETSDPSALGSAVGDALSVTTMGDPTTDGKLSIDVAGRSVTTDAESIASTRSKLDRTMD